MLDKSTLIIIIVASGIAGTALLAVFFRFVFSRSSVPLPPVQPLAHHREQQLARFESARQQRESAFLAAPVPFHSIPSHSRVSLQTSLYSRTGEGSEDLAILTPLAPQSPVPPVPNNHSTVSVSSEGFTSSTPLHPRPHLRSKSRRSLSFTSSPSRRNSLRRASGLPHGPHSQVQVILPEPLGVPPLPSRAKVYDPDTPGDRKSAVVDRWIPTGQDPRAKFPKIVILSVLAYPTLVSSPISISSLAPMAYPHPPVKPVQPILKAFENSEVLVNELATFIAAAQKEAIDKKGRFTVAISGGSLPKSLTGLINLDGIKWDKWHVFFVDERVVPLDDKDSNYKSCDEHLFSKVSIPLKQIHTIKDLKKTSDDDRERIPDEEVDEEFDNLLEKGLDNLSKDDSETLLDKLSDDYEKQLIQEFAQKDSARFPVFDLILLGVGDDGHTASLFPHHPLLDESDRWVAYLDDSPKLPPRRITLTYPVINHGARVVFVATGSGKEEILGKVFAQYREVITTYNEDLAQYKADLASRADRKSEEDSPSKNAEEPLPASRVQPHPPGHLWWFVDNAAVGKVQYHRES